MAAPDKKPDRRTALTSIPERIHCAATPDAAESQDELDQIAIDSFLDALAEIALAVARRRQLEP